MLTDDEMAQLLKAAMAGPAPELSPGAGARVMRRVRSQRLPPLGRIVLGCYAVAATVVTAWLVREVNATWLLASVAIGAAVAGTVGAYCHRLAIRV
jgi:hypothetical protein